MFTGIIEEVGRVTGIAQENGNRRLTVAASQLNQELKTGRQHRRQRSLPDCG